MYFLLSLDKINGVITAPYCIYVYMTFNPFFWSDSMRHAFLVGNWHGPCDSSILQWRCQLTRTGIWRSKTSSLLELNINRTATKYCECIGCKRENTCVYWTHAIYRVVLLNGNLVGFWTSPHRIIPVLVSGSYVNIRRTIPISVFYDHNVKTFQTYVRI